MWVTTGSAADGPAETELASRRAPGAALPLVTQGDNKAVVGSGEVPGEHRLHGTGRAPKQG